MTTIVRTVLVCIFALLAAFARPGAAAYPDRPISMIIAYVPGGGTDVVARVLAVYLE